MYPNFIKLLREKKITEVGIWEGKFVGILDGVNVGYIVGTCVGIYVGGIVGILVAKKQKLNWKKKKTLKENIQIKIWKILFAGENFSILPPFQTFEKIVKIAILDFFFHIVLESYWEVNYLKNK